MAKDPQPRRLGAGLQGARDLDRAGLVRALQHLRRAARAIPRPERLQVVDALARGAWKDQPCQIVCRAGHAATRAGVKSCWNRTPPPSK